MLDSKKRNKNYRISGFSLLEIIIAVTIVGIVTALAVLGFRKTIAHQKLNGETGRAVLKLRYVASEARTSKREIAVYADFQNNFIFAWNDANTNGVFDSSEAVIDSMHLETGIDLIAGHKGAVLKSGAMFFYIHEDGSPDDDMRLALYSRETEEFQGLVVKRTSGWVEEYELTDGQKQSLKNYIDGS